MLFIFIKEISFLLQTIIIKTYLYSLILYLSKLSCTSQYNCIRTDIKAIVYDSLASNGFYSLHDHTNLKFNEAESTQVGT